MTVPTAAFIGGFGRGAAPPVGREDAQKIPSGRWCKSPPYRVIGANSLEFHDSSADLAALRSDTFRAA